MLRSVQLSMRHIWGVHQPLSTLAGGTTKIVAYNSLFKKKVPFLTKDQDIVNWYICGPTVYDSTHIGHAWCYMHFDIIRRIMHQHFCLNVVQVMNITNIDDKIINKSQDQKVDFKELALKYETEFLEDMDALGIQRPTLMTRVSDYLPQIVSFVERLLEQGLAYKTADGSVYFDVNAYSSKYAYGKLKPPETSGNTPSVKQSSLDFALWKAAKSSTEPHWISSWGSKGRPGWHIECSAMASHIFGSSLDLHSGGVDLLFPHHENEEAQCCAYHETSQWVGHWLHVGHLKLPDGVKMSKSLKNTITVREFLSTHTADQFRMFCLISNYRKDMEFSKDSLMLAVNILDSVRMFAADCAAFLQRSSFSCSDIDASLLLSTLNDTKVAVETFLADDFNTAEATKAVRQLISITQREMTKPQTLSNNPRTQRGISAVASVLNYVSKYFNSLGFSISGVAVMESSHSVNVSSLIDDMIEFRRQVRQHALNLPSTQISTETNDRDGSPGSREILLTACDKLRYSLKSKGIQLKDYPNETTWTLTSSTRSKE